MSLHDPEQENPLANVEAEAALLGALMIDNRHVDMAADRLSPDDFSEGVYGRVFSAIVAEHSKGKPCNPVTLKPYVGDDETLKAMGGVGYLAKLTGSSAAMLGARGYIDQIEALASRRRLVTGLSETIGLASDPATTPEKLIEAADSAIMDATRGNDPVHQVSAAQALDELLSSYNEPIRGAECKVIGCVDRLLGPLRPKQLVIGAARPGMGKTAFAISYALGASQAGHGVLLISLEMGSVELAGRMAADLCFDGQGGVPYESIRDGKLDTSQRLKVARTRDMLADMPLHIVDAGSMTIGRLAMIVRRYKRRFAARGEKLELVIVDYLQLLSPSGKSSNRNEAVGEISRGLKVIAKDQGVAVMALSQLSREVEKRADKRPQLSDLRESGSIEQDADTVLFLYRHEYYLRQTENEGEESADLKAALAECTGKIDFICAKRRNGRTGSMQGHFFGGNQAVRG